MKIPSPLHRYPRRKYETLQAWDAADELLLEHLAAQDLGGRRILILNDAWGALRCALSGALGAGADLTSYTDSFVAAQALAVNSGASCSTLHRLEELTGVYDLVLLKVPKNMSFFEDQLAHLSGHLGPASRVIGAGMIKHLAPSAFDLLNRLIGSTTTSLAKKKARLIFAGFERGVAPSRYPVRVRLDGFDQEFIHHSNLFSREKLDVGTRFFLEHLPEGEFRAILDLGCGNGVVGIRAKQLNPVAQVIFSDESAMAIDSARTNYDRHFADRGARFFWTHAYEGEVPGSLDLVLCNPPFHQENAVGASVAGQMFTDSLRALRTGGLLRVIGNTPLGYPVLLKKIFGNSQIVAQNAKFTVVDAVKR